METGTTPDVPHREENGIASVGGTSSLKFAGDGDTSSSVPRPTSVFASFVRMARSRPLPLIIDYVDKHHDITAEGEEGIILALRHRERVRRIRLLMPVPNLQKLVAAIDKEFPALLYLYIGPPTKHNTILRLPKTFRAAHLCHLILINMTFPIGCSFLMSAVDLVTLSLRLIHPSAYFSPNILLQRLSSMP